MAIEKLFRVQCDQCERYLARPGRPLTACLDSAGAELFVTLPGTVEAAVEAGWQDAPAVLCPDCANAPVTIVLFKPGGRYYTQEKWRIPTPEQVVAAGGHVADTTGPACMRYSPDFRRIGGTGAVLVETQEPWGFPHLFESVSE